MVGWVFLYDHVVMNQTDSKGLGSLHFAWVTALNSSLNGATQQEKKSRGNRGRAMALRSLLSFRLFAVHQVDKARLGAFPFCYEPWI